MRTRRTVLATLLALTLAAGACGDSNSDDGDDATNTTTGDNSGPFAVPTSACPADVNTPLADGAPIKIGLSLPQSGPAAAFDLIRVGMQIAIDKQNKAGGVDGHQIELIAKDDTYLPAKSQANVKEFIEKDKIFASFGQIGTPNVANSQADHEAACVPQISVNTGAPQWGDPQNHPWTTGALLAYNTEAEIWAEYIADEKPGAKVGLLIYNNEFGKAYQEAFEPAAEEAGLDIVVTELHDANTDTKLSNQVTNLLAAQPDYILGGTTGAFCSGLMVGLAKDFKGQTIISSTCASTASFFKPIDPAGNGVMVLTSIKDPADPSVANDADVKQFKADVAEFGKGANPNDTTTAAGWVQATNMIDVMKRAAELDGGLTRANLMNAAWNTDIQLPLLLGKTVINGTDDAYGVETLEFVRYDASTSSMKFTDIKFDREGQTGLFTD